MPTASWYSPDPRFPELGEGFSDAVVAAEFPQHTLRYRNQPWAMRIGLGSLSAEEWTGYMGQLEPLPDNIPSPLALRYHGHQFRQYNPQLGDGRGFLHAQLRDPVDGRLLDLGTKGSGTTPWSRGGDGRLTLKGGVREVLATSMLEALGVNTSKTLSLIETGESLVRHDEPSPTRASIMVRLSHGHIRFGSFQRLAYLNERERIGELIAYSVRHYLPEVDAEAEDLGSAFFEAVVERSAKTCAAWMVAGFVHAVLNTDNLNITGESFDYGPYRFLPTCDPGFTAAYFDNSGLYAYGRQPDAVGWNLARLADCLVGHTTPEALAPAFSHWGPAFTHHTRIHLLGRLGLESGGDESDSALTHEVFRFLEETRIGFDQFFYDWYGGTASEERAAKSPISHIYLDARFKLLRARFAHHKPVDASRLSLPYFSRAHPCTMLIDEIEGLWEPIAEHDDWSLFDAKLAAVAELSTAMGNTAPMPEEALTACPLA